MRTDVGTLVKTSRGSRAFSQSIELLEPRCLLSGQAYAGEGPIVGIEPRSVATADMDGDGKADLITANYSGYLPVSVTLGHGDGTFDNYADTADGGTYATSVVAADFDGDGAIDLAVTNSKSDTVTVLRNIGLVNGVMTFTRSTLSTAGGPQALVQGDFNHDDKIDLAVATSTGGTVLVLKNISTPGNVSFAAAASFSGLTTARSITSGDFDGDGSLDLAVGSGTSISLLHNATAIDEAVNFVPALSLSVSGYGLAAADFNNDGSIDLAASNGAVTGGAVTILTNYSLPGLPNFGISGAIPTASTPLGLNASDFNGDGKIDLAVASNVSTGQVSVLQNNTTPNGGSTFTVTNYLVGPTPYVVAAADFDGDGKADLAVPATPINNIKGYVAVLHNQSPAGGGVAFAGNSSVDSLGSPPQLTASADFDGDGKTDVVVANYTGGYILRVLRNTTAPGAAVSFAASGPFQGGVGFPTDMITADIDGDGKMDLITTSYSNGVAVLRNTSTPGIISFAASVSATSTASATSLAAGDFDGDGKIDLAVASSVGRIRVARNTSNPGTLSFETGIIFETVRSDDIVAGDFDGDGRVDLAVAGQTIVAMRNTSTGVGNINFALTVQQSGSSSYHRVIAGDFNLDGKLDLAVSESSDNQSFFASMLSTSTPGSIAFNGGGSINYLDGYVDDLDAVDFDGDGRIDLVANSRWSNAVTLMHNIPSTKGRNSFLLSAVPAGPNAYGVSVGDFNADNRPDLAVANASSVSGVSNSGSMTVLLNQLPANPYATLASGTLTLSGNVSVSLAAGQITVITPAGPVQYLATAVSGVMIKGTAIVMSDLGAGNQRYNVTVSSSGSVTFNTTQHLAALAVDVSGTATLAGGGGKLLQTTELNIGPLAILDLNDNDLIFDYSAVSSQLTVARMLIRYAWAEGLWIGPGLTSTAAKNSVGRLTSLGYMEASDYKAIYGAAAKFEGETIDSTAVLVRYTLYGDADFNRSVDFNDFLKLQNGFGGTNSSFAQGDFNYDGATDFNDFLAMQNNFGQSLPVPREGGATPVKTPPPAPPAPKNTASVSGFAFNDGNRNGLYDKGDTLAAGKTVWLDLDNDGVKDANEPAAVTDAQGKYAFKNLAAGKYRVRRVFAGGYVESTPARYVTLASGQAVAGVAVGSRVK